MIKLLKLEFERAFRSRGMTAALICGYAIAIIQFVCVPLANSHDILRFFDGSNLTYPYTVFGSWLGMDDTHPWDLMYRYLIPLLAVLPFGATYFSDIRAGYIKNICTRTAKWKYLAAKYVAVFVSGGVTVVLPMLLNLLLTAAVLPSLAPSTNSLYSIFGGSMFATLFYEHPYGYIALYLFMYFIYGGVFSSLALLMKGMARYRFEVVLFPFVVYYILGLTTGYFVWLPIGVISPRHLLSMTQGIRMTEAVFFGEPVIIGIMVMVIYAWMGVRDDIF